MKIPEIFGKNKIRDAKICRMYADDDKSTDEIAEIFKLTQRRIIGILYKNRAFLNLDKGWERAKRINFLKRQIKKKGDSKKDVVDLLALLRDEIDGKPGVNIKQYQQTINYGSSNGKLNGQDKERQEELRRELEGNGKHRGESVI